MDFQIFGEETLRIKGKKVAIAIDPQEKITKFDAEGILLTSQVSDVSRVSDYRIVISGPGEYEVSGLKISGIKSEDGVIFSIVSDNANVLVARASALEKMSTEKLEDYKIIVINADSELNHTLVTAMEPRVVILYGKNKQDAAKKLGSSESNISSKVSVSEDKLPEELEVTLLG